VERQVLAEITLRIGQREAAAGRTVAKGGSISELSWTAETQQAKKVCRHNRVRHLFLKYCEYEFKTS